MNSLVRFLLRNRNFFVFIIVETIAFSILVQNNSFHHAKFFNKTSVIVARFYQTTQGLNEFFFLKNANKQLAIQNAHILNTLKSSYKANKVSYKELRDSLYARHWRYIVAEVVNNSVYRQNNFLTLNVGSKQGVRTEMGVVGPLGVVGIVTSVSENFSTVISLLNPNLSISARLRNSKYFGALKWDGVNPQFCDFQDVPNHILVTNGDTIETSGYSAFFPAKIPIGVVYKSVKTDDDNFYHIKVQLFMDFQALTHVYVVENLFNNEIANLKMNINKND